MRKNVLSTVLLLSAILLPARAADDMKAFPPAGKGMVRHVLQLPKHEDESAFKVELIAGKTARVDRENRYFFGGRIEAETKVMKEG
jgi:ecotin